MAIYTQYGRYLKAKLFKEYLESNLMGGVYMVLGIGNPQWDNDINMPVASYDTESIKNNTSQFYDSKCSIEFLSNDDSIINVMDNGIPKGGTVINYCKNLLPAIPAIWKTNTNTYIKIAYDESNDPVYINQNEYSNFYINKDSSLNKYYLKYNNSSIYVYRNTSGDVKTEFTSGGLNAVVLPNGPETDDILARQYFAELYLRGLSKENNYKSPVGLLGVVKCSISYVRDIGFASDGNYTGGINQFWYGDRYWEIVEPTENLNGFLDDDKTIYPHHLLISSLINPLQLCSILNVDKNIVPRQLGIYVKEKSTNDTNSKIAFRVGDNIFNFGQYTDSELNGLSDTATVLQFIPNCTVNGKNYGNSNNIKERFKFILNDYIKGNARSDHAADRLGYIVGF